ncbi:MAG: hypothetical protein GX606_04685 [Elusimicrobia bacterium]|nr:hypothetical protein [Elusimicrobiota bacterium]
MKTFLLCVLAFFLVIPPAFSQSLDDKYDEVVGPMDRAAAYALEIQTSMPIPGAGEDAKDEGLRYEEATLPMEEAVGRHFETIKEPVSVAVEDAKTLPHFHEQSVRP